MIMIYIKYRSKHKTQSEAFLDQGVLPKSISPHGGGNGIHFQQSFSNGHVSKSEKEITSFFFFAQE